MKKIIVLAGSRKQFEEYLDQEGKTDLEMVYGSGPRAMHSVQGCEVLVIGSFWERKDAQDLFDLAMSRVY